MDDAERLMQDRANWLARHLDIYLGSGGREGHIVDLTDLGGRAQTPTLVLRTIGRISRRNLFAPLIYGRDGEDFIVIGSKAGASEHPFWFRNLREMPAAEFQVGQAAFRGTWSILEGDERSRIWRGMADIFPPYETYQAGIPRIIPVVRLHPEQDIGAFKVS